MPRKKTYLGFIFEDGFGKFVIMEVCGHNPRGWKLLHPLFPNENKYKKSELHMYGSISSADMYR